MIDVRIACDEIEARLRAEIPAELMAGYVGEVVEPVPHPPEDDRVSPYWALWAGPGRLETGRLFPASFVSVLPFVVTVVGGTVNRTLFGIEQVRKALAGVEISSGLISETDVDQGPIRPDLSITPTRHYVPLNYQLEP
jgi:hypothetical protein